MKNRLPLLLLVATLLLSACAGTAQAAPATVTAPAVSANETVVAEGVLVPGQHMDLAFPLGGRVKETLVAEGESVTAGQVLARLEGAESLLAQKAAANLEIIEARQALKDLSDNTLLALALASGELEAAQKDYDVAEKGWDGKDASAPTVFDTALADYIEAETAVRDAQELVNDEADQPADAPARLQTEKDLQREQERGEKAYAALLADYENPQEGSQTDTRTALLKAITRLEMARQRLADLNGGVDPDLAELLEARLTAIQEAQSAVEQGLLALEIRAPWAGTLVAWELEAGEVVGAGISVGAVIDVSQWYVETTDLTENSVASLKVGDPVEVTVDALPGKTFSGEIIFIGGKGVKYQGDMTYPVRIRLDQNDPHWYWNMNVKVTISP